MGVHLAIGELSRPPRQANSLRLNAPVLDAVCDDGTDFEHEGVHVRRDPLSFEMAHMVQLAIEMSGCQGMPAIGTRDALRSSISRQLEIVSGPTELGDRIGPFRAFLRRPRWLLSRACAVMLVSSMAAGTTFATAEALPDEPLHGVKLATEQLQVSLARSPEHLVAVELAIAGSRLREALVLEAQGRDASAEAAVSAYGEHIALAAATLAEIRPSAPATVLDQFRAQVVSQQQSVRRADVAMGAEQSAAGVRAAFAVVATAAQADDAGADSIASSAAVVATEAAAHVGAESSTRSTVPSTNSALPVPSSDAPAAPAVAVEAAPIASHESAPPNIPTVRPSQSVQATAPATPNVAPSQSAPTTTPAGSTAPATPSVVPSHRAPTTAPATPSAGSSHSGPTAASAAPVQKDDTTKAAAKAAESAARAQQAAERAKNASAETARDTQNAKDQQDQTPKK